MRKSTSINFKAVLIALFVVSLGIEMVSAAGFPSVKELYGRYKFSGECSYVDMVSGAAGEAPVPATTGYNMAVLPGESENELKVLGFFGYGGGVTLTYNQEDGTLKGETPTAVFMMGMNLMLVADAASTGGTVVFNYQVTEKDGKIEITAQNALENVTIMDMEDGIMGMLSYASAYTMTKEDISYNLSDVIGEYDFASTRVDNNLLADASENFKLKITGNTSETVPSGVSVGNWFGMENTEVAAEFYADGGILVLPHDVKLANGMCFGAQPEEEGGYNPNEASFFFVEKDKLVTPGYLVLDNGFDEVMEMPLQMAVIGGEAVKTGSGISSRCIKDVKIYGSDGSIRVEGLESAEISVFDAQGMLVSSVHGATAAFGSLKSGLYLVKVGSQTAKVVVK
ncbi:conserved domain protein [Paraprevotella xylaniphila YIT 11841]|uniref:Conserved domain protein n=1 Tax=Paraprevotella xylaniphila YIT 11841 TaxID=762982 RepID=F3QYE0_9BACT|nr:T9SS type A sorting domain-containing protein [Paraprevotella xylaniphila]EGG50487.1 conserved domain protein [Paraprevotella xylaniphila YIT 11841]